MEIRQDTDIGCQQYKKDLRKIILEKRNALSLQEQQEKSHRIIRQILQWNIYQEAAHVLCYVSYQSEVQTQELIRYALTQEKKVFCPKVLGQDAMEFYRIMDTAELEPGCHGILEPQEKREGSFFFLQKHQKGEKTIMLLPGVAFDKNCNRIGYGGGYYDRYLEQCCNLIQEGKLHTAALAYKMQIVEAMMTQEHDVGVEVIVTEEGMFGS